MEALRIAAAFFVSYNEEFRDFDFQECEEPSRYERPLYLDGDDYSFALRRSFGRAVRGSWTRYDGWRRIIFVEIDVDNIKIWIKGEPK